MFTPLNSSINADFTYDKHVANNLPHRETIIIISLVRNLLLRIGCTRSCLIGSLVSIMINTSVISNMVIWNFEKLIKSDCVRPPYPKDGVCFGPHALTPGFVESWNRQVFVAIISWTRTIESPLSVSSEIPQYSAWLYPQSHFLQIERTCHLTIGFYWTIFIKEVLRWDSKSKWAWSATISIIWILYICSM